MGYYVNTVSTNFMLKKKNLKKAYKAMCKLNEQDELKTGGSWGEGGKQLKTWFAWMDPDYPKTCKTAQEIIEQLGFDIETNDKGDIINLMYDNKTGAEEYFMESIAPYVEPGSYIEWQGEGAYDYYKYEFNGKTMEIKRGTIVY